MRAATAVIFAAISTAATTWLAEPIGYGAWAMRAGDGERIWLLHGGVMTRAYCEAGDHGPARYAVTGAMRGYSTLPLSASCEPVSRWRSLAVHGWDYSIQAVNRLSNRPRCTDATMCAPVVR